MHYGPAAMGWRLVGATGETAEQLGGNFIKVGGGSEMASEGTTPRAGPLQCSRGCPGQQNRTRRWHREAVAMQKAMEIPRGIHLPPLATGVSPAPPSNTALECNAVLMLVTPHAIHMLLLPR